MTAHISLPQLHDSDLDQRLGEEITLLAGQINAATHRLLTLIARFDERKAWSGGGTVRSCAHWLNWKCGIALGAAREKAGRTESRGAGAALPRPPCAAAPGTYLYPGRKQCSRRRITPPADF